MQEQQIYSLLLRTHYE